VARRPPTLALALAAALAAAGAAGDAGAAPAAAADSPAALRSLIEELVAAGQRGATGKAEALARGLVLPRPEAWFRRVFGAERAPALAAEYARLLARLARDLDARLAEVIRQGRTRVLVTVHRRADDPTANGNQRRALAAMRAPVALYSVRLVRPGRPSRGVHYYSFVHSGGAFRFVGTLRALAR
jgi:hypothetical protein